MADVIALSSTSKEVRLTASESISLASLPAAPGPEHTVITGTDLGEIITGTAGKDLINALYGDDVLNGSGEADFYDGGPGSDTVSYQSSASAVHVDMTLYVQRGGDAEGDVLSDIENITGSAHNDFLAGNYRDNVLNGGAGVDVLSGREGADRFVFDTAAHANGDIVTDYTSDDALDFRQISNLRWSSITNDGVNTFLKGDVTGDGVADFTVTVNGVHTLINGVNTGAILPPVSPPPQPLAPTISISDVTVDEANGQMVFTLTREGYLGSASSVRFITSDGTARADFDYVWQQGEVTFAPGETTKTISVEIINDAVAEGIETFGIDLLEGVNAQLEGGYGLGTITDTDTITVPRVSVNDVTVNENAGEIVFTLTRTGSLNVVSKVDFDVTDETAWQEDDYVAQMGTITFGIGEATKTIRLPLINDNVVEAPETMRVQIYENENVTVDKWEGVATILSDDVPPTLITGTATDDTLKGTAGNDRMEGLAGSDLLYGSAGADELNGGAGNDVASYFFSKTGVNVSLARESQVGGDAEGDVLVNIERLAGSTHNDVLTGDALGNTIDGHWGDDIINGGGGVDWLLGGRGNDTFVFDSAADANGDFIGDWNAGDRIDISRIDANRLLAGKQDFTFIHSLAFDGIAGRLRLTNDGVNSFLSGDTDGDGKADFTIKIAGVQTDLPPVTLNLPTISGTAGNNTLFGTVAAERINGLAGDDVIYGSRGADIIEGGAGSDAVNYLTSVAAVNVDLKRAIQIGGDAEGDQLINVERVRGSELSDTIRGDDGGNVLNGGAGDDVIEGRGGPDWMFGGAGNDTFVFNTTAETWGDRISDWNKGDILDLRNIDANTKVAGDQNFRSIGANAFTKTAGELRVTTDGVNTTVSGDVNGDGVADFSLAIDGIHDMTGQWWLG